MNTNRRKIGAWGEKLACEFLKQQGLKFIEKNFYSRFGEIDLIMQDQDSLVFVEVKLRGAGITNAIESITPQKQRRLVKTAQFYLLKKGFDINCRFDAVVIESELNIEWLKNIIIL